MQKKILEEEFRIPVNTPNQNQNQGNYDGKDHI